MGRFARDAFADQPIRAKDRVTPLDRAKGMDKSVFVDDRKKPADFIDPTDERNYVVASLSWPIGLSFRENPTPGMGGIFVDKIIEGGTAGENGLSEGDQLILVDGVDVSGLDFDEATEPIHRAAAAGAPLSLALFRGDSEYFYGDWGPEPEWVQAFAQKLEARERNAAQGSPEGGDDAGVSEDSVLDQLLDDAQ